MMRLPYIEMFAMTPLKGAGYVRRAIYNKRDTDPEITIVKGSIHDNSTLSKKEVEYSLNSFQDDLRRQAREFGDFVFFGGLVFPEFERHVIDPADVPPLGELDVVIGIDPGIRNAGFVWMGFDRDNTCWVFDDRLIQDGTPIDYLNCIRSVNKEWGIENPTYVMDPSGRNRSAVNGEDIQGVLNRMGIFPVPGYNPVEAGLMDIRKRMAAGAWKLSRKCRGLIEEFEEYRMEETPDGEMKIVKERDHRADAHRYACMYRAWGGYEEKTKESRAQVFQPGEPFDFEAAFAADSGPELPLGEMM